MSFTVSKDSRMALLNIATQVRMSWMLIWIAARRWFRACICGICMISNWFVNTKGSLKDIMSITQRSVGPTKSSSPVAVKVCFAEDDLLFWRRWFFIWNRFKSVSVASTSRTSDHDLLRSYTYSQLCFMASDITVTLCISLGRCNCPHLVYTGTSNETWSVEHALIVSRPTPLLLHLESVPSNDSSSSSSWKDPVDFSYSVHWYTHTSHSLHMAFLFSLSWLSLCVLHLFSIYRHCCWCWSAHGHLLKI